MGMSRWAVTCAPARRSGSYPAVATVESVAARLSGAVGLADGGHDIALFDGVGGERHPAVRPGRHVGLDEPDGVAGLVVAHLDRDERLLQTVTAALDEDEGVLGGRAVRRLLGEVVRVGG